MACTFVLSQVQSHGGKASHSAPKPDRESLLGQGRRRHSRLWGARHGDQGQRKHHLPRYADMRRRRRRKAHYYSIVDYYDVYIYYDSLVVGLCQRLICFAARRLVGCRRDCVVLLVLQANRRDFEDTRSETPRHAPLPAPCHFHSLYVNIG
eukprot:COSAG02_NODE_3464_length_6695_cov_12.759854_4_plen_151_part_00